jgi:predicted CDP-diglyceride synthetase/phosphatidate cytidylyltransferase
MLAKLMSLFLLGLGRVLTGAQALVRLSSQGRTADLAIAFVACAAGSMGHLVMKALKRDRGVTWGHRGISVTGANGLLDRVDALCFAAPSSSTRRAGTSAREGGNQ